MCNYCVCLHGGENTRTYRICHSLIIDYIERTFTIEISIFHAAVFPCMEKTKGPTCKNRSYRSRKLIDYLNLNKVLSWRILKNTLRAPLIIASLYRLSYMYIYFSKWTIKHKPKISFSVTYLLFKKNKILDYSYLNMYLLKLQAYCTAYLNFANL